MAAEIVTRREHLPVSGKRSSVRTIPAVPPFVRGVRAVRGVVRLAREQRRETIRAAGARRARAAGRSRLPERTGSRGARRTESAVPRTGS